MDIRFLASLIVAAVWLVSTPKVFSQTTGPDIPAGLSEQEVAGRWLGLFDGETLFGWKAEQGDWTAEDGMLKSPKGGTAWVRTTTQFDDYYLRMDYHVEDDTESQLFLRTSPAPTSNATGGDCYELALTNGADVDRSPGALIGRSPAMRKISIGNGWHQVRVVVSADVIRVYIDKDFLLEYHDEKPLGRGFIGIRSTGHIQLKDIQLVPIDINPLFSGTDLEGWRTDQTKASEFTATPEGELAISSGPGQLESAATFGDFIFSTQVRTNADGLNSGVFFRSIPGDYSNGYESQIQNECHNDDLAKPVDCGTGGIFRRVDARRVNAFDQEWFSKTIIAVGPHISVWVNGYQVTDWTDKRKPDANPRRGLRTDAGTIILQGHDPTTDILMKDLRCREMEARNR